MELEETSRKAFYSIWGEIYPRERKIRTRFSPLVLPGSGGTITIYDTCNGDERTEDQTLPITDNLLEFIDMGLDQNYAILEGNNSSSTVFGQDIGSTGRLKWEKMTPDSPPAEDCFSFSLPGRELVRLGSSLIQ